MKTPFDWIATEKQKSVFIFLVVLTIIVMACLQILGKPLSTDAAPGGIVSFEFAGDPATARAILDSWGVTGQVYAGLNLGLDFLFLFAYASSIGLGCLLVAQSLLPQGSLIHKMGLWLSWGLPVAAILDCVENYALIRLLLGSTSAVWPTVARWCAIPKFTLVVLGLLFVLIGGVAALFRRQKLN
ncbi:MAG: hypothetical protein H6657_18605 [Ardenticatenaceae bacterium]|nr:hypothetical protein [Ardenticatenaceae bacterium]